MTSWKTTRSTPGYIKKVPDGMGTWLAIFDNRGDVTAAISKRPDTTTAHRPAGRAGGRDLCRLPTASRWSWTLKRRSVKQTLKYAKKYGKKVYAAVSNMSIAVERRDFLQQIDCFVCNQQEAGHALLGRLRPSRRLRRCAGCWPRQCAQRQHPLHGGDHGRARVLCLPAPTASAASCPAKKVDVIDTTGAGDAFFAGTVIGLTYGKTLAESCEIGSRLAASVICITENVCPRFRPLEFGLDIPVVD